MVFVLHFLFHRFSECFPSIFFITMTRLVTLLLLVFFCNELSLIKCLQAVKQKGGAFVEAPVSGSKKPAEDGQLVILAAGDKVTHSAVMITCKRYCKPFVLTRLPKTKIFSRNHFLPYFGLCTCWCLKVQYLQLSAFG